MICLEAIRMTPLNTPYVLSTSCGSLDQLWEMFCLEAIRLTLLNFFSLTDPFEARDILMQSGLVASCSYAYGEI